ncbi:MAG: ketose-bisphosphate aldolase [Firmicutes bacterium]|nr:ketose-bisphosphate aldolase [Bacillota bacterium]
MTLVNMKELIARADAAGTGVGAFNVGDMEMIMGVVKAAEETDTPVILQIAEGRLPFSPLHIIGPAMVAAAKKASVDIAVHLDHGRSRKVIRQALDLGFTSVMYDGSSMPMKGNLQNTQQVVTMAKEYGAAVECEIGVVGGNEGGDYVHKIRYTDPVDAKVFSEKTGADAMAVAIGNAHGVYEGEPLLRFDILKQIRQKSALPLVLHGGSGISDEDFREAIRCGIRKVNIATASFMSAMEHAGAYLNGEGSAFAPGAPNWFGMSDAMVQGTYENVRHHIRVFQMR